MKSTRHSKNLMVREAESKDVASYVQTKPLHPSQKSEWLDDKLPVTIEVIPNYELESLILSFGEKVIVKTPQNLIQVIKSRLSNATE